VICERSAHLWKICAPLGVDPKIFRLQTRAVIGLSE